MHHPNPYFYEPALCTEAFCVCECHTCKTDNFNKKAGRSAKLLFADIHKKIKQLSKVEKGE